MSSEQKEGIILFYSKWRTTMQFLWCRMAETQDLMVSIIRSFHTKLHPYHLINSNILVAYIKPSVEYKLHIYWNQAKVAHSTFLSLKCCEKSSEIINYLIGVIPGNVISKDQASFLKGWCIFFQNYYVFNICRAPFSSEYAIWLFAWTL